ncbi:DUF434 domain-containing protein [Streptococcus mutans]|nr:DUF434 domain-containing protein [Streptococcus mutans]MCB5048353.1 DUF434 domain-containing protein [Streptococcus mutans]MCB5157759.1 DUF434 domain-containing protein [Streptococcus mutans]
MEDAIANHFSLSHQRRNILYGTSTSSQKRTRTSEDG